MWAFANSTPSFACFPAARGRLNFGLAAGALAHVLMIAPLAMGHGGPLAPVLLATWGLAREPSARALELGGGGRGATLGVLPNPVMRRNLCLARPAAARLASPFLSPTVLMGGVNAFA